VRLTAWKGCWRDDYKTMSNIAVSAGGDRRLRSSWIYSIGGLAQGRLLDSCRNTYVGGDILKPYYGAA